MAVRYRSGSALDRGKTGRPGRVERLGESGEELRGVRSVVTGFERDGRMICAGGPRGVGGERLVVAILGGLVILLLLRDLVIMDCCGGCDCSNSADDVVRVRDTVRTVSWSAGEEGAAFFLRTLCSL